MYSSLGSAPNIIAPDSICYYSESNGLGFSNATNDLALYFNSETGKSTGSTVSVIKVNAARHFARLQGWSLLLPGCCATSGMQAHSHILKS